MGGTVSRTDFDWVYTEEPHATRRKQILEKYPEMKKLMGTDHNMKYKVTLLVVVNIILAYLVKDSSWLSIFLLAYFVGGVINHALSLAIHEIAHNLAYGHTRPLANRILGFFANLPIGIPMSISFRKYHLEHHRYQGDDKRDVDIPTKLEALIFVNTFTKLIWVILQPFFYAVRPLFVYPKPMSGFEIINLVTQLTFNYIIFSTMGIKPLVYLLGGTILAMGLHPVAGHFIAEHYVFVKGFETYSYYGILNLVTFNVGYHNEHHDFPNIPGTRLPEVRKIAPEFYDTLPRHDSYVKVIWDFITKPEIGPYARIRRTNEAKKNGYQNGHANGDAKSNGVKANGHTTVPNGHTAALNGHITAQNGYQNGEVTKPSVNGHTTNGHCNGATDNIKTHIR